MGALIEYIKEQAEKKKQSSEEWLTKVAKNANKCTFATHVGRFTNPDVKVIWQADAGVDLQSGYVTTESVHCQDDIATGANYLATAKLLSLTLEDGQTVYAKLSKDKEALSDELSALVVDYDQIVEDLLQVQKHPQPTASDERLRQVYFPIGKNNYHLLSVLPPSSLMIELSRRIRQMETQRIDARNTKSESYGESYKQLYDLSLQSFGGTKPQNISYLNNEMGGRTYLLMSVSPQIQLRDVVRPRKDFFRNTLQLRDFWALFTSLHENIFLNKKKNMNIRDHRDKIVEALIDRVMLKVFALRQLDGGWSDADTNELPQAQKIWLDAKYVVKRVEDDTWQDEIVQTFTRWLMQAYERVMRQNKITFGDGEFNVLKEVVHNAVRNTVEKTSA